MAEPELYCDVDVAIVMESTYPFRKGGVSAVIHDIVTGNPDLTFGILHIAWDSKSPSKDIYGAPSNVKWVSTTMLSMAEHPEFRSQKRRHLKLRRKGRQQLAHRVFDAVEAALDGDVDPLWLLYDEGLNPNSRTYPLWALLCTREFMEASSERASGLGMSLTNTFWLMRDFFSVVYALLSTDWPNALVYHAHTTGYASLVGAAAARQNGTQFLLTEHNLYVRDTINTMLDRSLALPVAANDWREVTPPERQYDPVTKTERAWMAWWIEIGRFCYPSAAVLTYLFPQTLNEAADLGAPVERSTIIPNGVRLSDFETPYSRRKAALPAILSEDPQHKWRLAYIARVVPIKGLADLIDSVHLLNQRGITNFSLEVMGPTEETPDYYAMCQEKVRLLELEEYVFFRGTVNVREVLGHLDVLVMSSYNEGQPVVALEAMASGVPLVGTTVGGMAQLVTDPLTTADKGTWGPAGTLSAPGDVVGMADALQRVMTEPKTYRDWSANARGRVEDFFLFEDAMAAYNRLYRELGELPIDGSRKDRVADVVDSSDIDDIPQPSPELSDLSSRTE